MHKKGWMNEEGIYLFACLFSFRFVAYQITKHVSSMYHKCRFDFARLFRTTIFIKANDQHCVSFYLLEIVPVTVIKKVVLGKYSPIRCTQTLAVIFSRN